MILMSSDRRKIIPRSLLQPNRLKAGREAQTLAHIRLYIQDVDQHTHRRYIQAVRLGHQFSTYSIENPRSRFWGTHRLVIRVGD